MKKLIILVIAFVTVPVLANAAVVALGIGNAIFSGLYSIGISGAIANAVANSAFAISAVGEIKMASFK